MNGDRILTALEFLWPTHEFLQEAMPELLRDLAGNYYAAKTDCAKSRTSIALQRMLEIHRPERYFGGHYHISREFALNGTVFRCLAEMEKCDAGSGSSG